MRLRMRSKRSRASGGRATASRTKIYRFNETALATSQAFATDPTTGYLTMDVKANLDPTGTNPCRVGQLGSYETLFRYFRVRRISITFTWLGSTVDGDDASLAEVDPDVPIVYAVWDPDGDVTTANFALGKYKQINLGPNRRSWTSTWSRCLEGVTDLDGRQAANSLINTMPRRMPWTNIFGARTMQFYGPKFFVRLQRGTVGPPPTPRIGYFDIKTSWSFEFCGERVRFGQLTPPSVEVPEQPDVVNVFDAVGEDGVPADPVEKPYA